MAPPKKPKPTPPPTPPGLDASEAVARAAKYAGKSHKNGMCQQFAEESILGHGGVYDSATDYYNWANKQKSIQTSAPPAGVPVFYAGSTKNKYGHVAVSAGGGYVYSTDVDGKVAKVPYNKLWGGKGSGTYLGWTGAIQSTRGGKTTRIGYDPKSVGKAPKVTVKSIPAASPSPSPSPGAAPKTSVNSSKTTVTFNDEPTSGAVGLSALQPNISKQFSNIAVGGNVPRVR